MKVKIKGIVGDVLSMEAVCGSQCGVLEVFAYEVKILTDDGMRVEFGMVSTDKIEVLS